MTRPSLALLGALLASACAAHRSSSDKSAKAAIPKEEVVCFKESPTGSHIVQRVCYPKAELDTATAAAQDAMRRAAQAGAQTRTQGPPPQTRPSSGK